MKQTLNVKKRDVNFIMEKFRLIKDNITNPVKHYALEEAMMRLMDTDKLYPNTIRLRRVKKSILIGFLENPFDTVNVEFAKSHGVKILRRHNLGGTVYQNLGSFMFTVLFRNGTFISLKTEEEIYKDFNDFIILFLSKCGIEGKLRGVNDVVVNGRKIFGSARTMIGDAVSHTGSVLVNMDLEFLSKLLKFVEPKFSDKKFKSIGDALTTISIESGRKIPIFEIYNKFLSSFQEKFNVELYEDKLKDKELSLMNQFVKEKYGKEEWTFSREIDYEEIYTKKVKSGLIFIKGIFKKNFIDEIKISGDFLAKTGEEIVKLEKSVRGKSFEKAENIISNFDVPQDIKLGIIELIREIEKEHK